MKILQLMSKSTKGTVLFHVMFPMHNSVNIVKLAARASAGAVMIWFGCRIYTGPTLEGIHVNCQHCCSSTSLPKWHTLYFWKLHLSQVLQVFIIINGKIRSGLIVIGLMPAKCSNLIMYVLFIIPYALHLITTMHTFMPWIDVYHGEMDVIQWTW